MTARDRDSSVTLGVILRLPKADVKLFIVASIKGSWVPPSGARGPLGSGERAVATRLSRTQRRAVCEAVGITEKTFHNAASRWLADRLAHRCGNGVVTVFSTRLGGDAAICPSCRKPLVRPSRDTGADLPAAEANVSHDTGTSDVGIRPPTSRNAPIARKVNQQGEEEGDHTGEERTPLQRLLDEEQQAFARLRAVFPEIKEEIP